MSEASNDYFYHKWQETLEKNRELMIVVKTLLDVLPDNGCHPDDESWDWAWETLSSDAQEEVEAARSLAPWIPKGNE